MKPKSFLTLSLILCGLVLAVFNSGAQTVTSIAAGYYDSLFLENNGSLWGTGGNFTGQLGDGTYNNTNRPEKIVASNVTAVAGGGSHSLFLKSGGSLWAMGRELEGQLGDGINDYYTNRFEQIVAGGVTAIAAGADHSLFLKTDGSLWATGNNYYGQLGDGIVRTYISSGTNRPEQIVASGVIAIAAGNANSLFLMSNGSLWGMGNNSHGQLGDGTYDSGNYASGTIPEQIVAGGVIAIAAGLYHTLFIKNDGSLWAMGDNFRGQLGDGTTNGGMYATNLPEQIVASGVVAIAAGFYHTLFLKNDGSLWATGLNNFGQLGDGTIINADRPKLIVASNVTTIAAGGYHSLFRKNDGSLWSMGWNNYGQLGLGTTNIAEVHTPVQIVPLTFPISLYASYNFADNGSFETGDFTDNRTGYPLGWDLSGNVTPDTLVSTKSGYVHSGTYGAQCGPVGALIYLSQLVPTTPGATYSLSFWLNSPDGEIPNEFLASWNGVTLMDKINLGAIGWTNLQFAVTATGASTLLQFGFRDDNTYLGLDDISVKRNVQPRITASSVFMTNLVLNGNNGLSGVTYRTLMTTNLAQPLNQWLRVATNVLGADGDFTITVTNTVNPSVSNRFYTLQLQ